MFDNDSLYFSSEEEEEEVSYPDFFYEWDEHCEEGKSPGYYEPDEMSEIIEIYLNEGEDQKAKSAIDHALKIFPSDDEMVYDVLLLLNDYEKWNDLLVLSEKYKNLPEVWPDGHRLSALLHLGMEEEAFGFFGKMKTKYADDKENLCIIYRAMGEALHEVNLYEASIEIVSEAVELFGGDEIEEEDILWLQFYNYLFLNDKEKVYELGEAISKIDPFDPTLWHRLGIAYKEADDLGKAIDAFEFSKSLDPQNHNNLIHLIQTYEQNGNYRKALENAVEYLSLFPNSYLLNIIASNICSQMEMWKDAIRFLDNAIEIIPSMDALYLYKSTYFLQLGEQRKAKQTLKEGIKNTDDPEKDLGNELKRLNDLYPNI